MTELTLTPNLNDADGFYAALIGAHDGLSEAESAAFNARLILILANHIGDRAVLQAALHAAHLQTDTKGPASTPKGEI